MPRGRKSGSSEPPESRVAPQPEGPEEVYRRFERLNRRGGGGGLRGLADAPGKRVLYGAFVVVEAAAIVLGFVLEVPYLDTLALVLPGLLVMFHGGSEDEERDKPGTEEEAGAGSDGDSGEGGLIGKLLELLGDGEAGERRSGSYQSGREP